MFVIFALKMNVRIVLRGSLKKKDAICGHEMNIGNQYNLMVSISIGKYQIVSGQGTHSFRAYFASSG